MDELNKLIVFFAKLPDTILSSLYLSLKKEKPSLVVFTFHSLFKNKKEIGYRHIDPQLGITLEHFDQFIQYFLKYEYEFIAPYQIINGLDANKKYVMITFDDGYYNNILSVPYLKKYEIPATFFISMDHISKRKCFWWDVQYRERLQQGFQISEILNEQEQLKLLPNKDIEKKLQLLFGKEILDPLGDIDRPFTINELKHFSEEPFVFLGNHTKNHAILTNLPSNEITEQIQQTQNFITGITGSSNPQIISYPNGNYSEEVINIAKKLGLEIGFTTDEKKNFLPLPKHSNALLTLGRFDITENDSINKQCLFARSDFVMYQKIIKLIKKKY